MKSKLLCQHDTAPEEKALARIRSPFPGSCQKGPCIHSCHGQGLERHGCAFEEAVKEDAFLRDLTFTGVPSKYRQVRRKVLLSVASLEDKQIRLAGPRILTRLQGEAWRATEHLSVAERSADGWRKILAALDSHYRFLPETELNKSVDEFLFGVRRRPNEGPTAFISRFRTCLSRLETLIAADKAAQRHQGKRRRRRERTGELAADWRTGRSCKFFIIVGCPFFCW